MAGSPAEIPLTLKAELGQLRADLAQIPGITEEQARLMVAELNKSFKAAEAAAKKAAEATRKGWDGARKSTKEATDATLELEDGFGGAGSSAAKLAGALGILSPAAGEVARNIADIADVGEVATTAMSGLSATKGGMTALLGTLGPVGIAIGLLGAGFMAYQAEAEKAAAATEKAKEAAATAATAFNTLRDALAEAKIKQMELNGELTKAQADALRAGQSIAKQFSPALATAAQRLEELKTQEAELRQQYGRGGLGMAGLKKRLDETSAAVVAQRAEVRSLGGQYLELQNQTATNITTEAAQADAIDETKNAVAAAKVELKDFTAAWNAALAAMDEDTAATLAVVDATERLRQAAAAADANRLEGAAKIRAARDQELAQLEQQYQAAAALTVADGNQRAELNEAYQAARVAVAADADRQIEEAHKASLKASEAALEASLAKEAAAREAAANMAWDVAQKVASALGDIWGVYADARVAEGEALAAALANNELGLSAEMRAEAEARLDDQRSKAMLAFRVAQGLALAQATMAAWKAAAEAYAATAAIPGLGLAAAPAAAALTFSAIEGGAVAQIAAQEPPSFATGGVAAFSGGVAGGADHVAVSARELMGILTPRGVDAEGGPRAVAARNRGQAPSSTVVAVAVQGSAVADRSMRRQLEGAGALGRRVVRRGKGGHGG